MNDLPKALTDLFPSVHSHSKRALLIQELQQQVARDFKQEQPPKPNEILFFIKKNLEPLESNLEKLRDLLYRIDLEEKSYDKVSLSEYSIEDLAVRILKREAQKVVFRLQYSGKL